MEEGSSFSAQPYQPAQTYAPPTAKKPKRVLFFVIFVILLGLLIFGATRFIGSNNKEQKGTLTATPTEEAFPTDSPTPTPEESPTPEVTKTPTPRPTSNPLDPTTGLNRSNLSIEVQNGSGEVGVASKASDFLKSLGYRVVATGNADNFNYADVTVLVKSDFSKYLSLFKSDLGKQYTVGSSSATLSASSSANALVIVGK